MAGLHRIAGLFICTVVLSAIGAPALLAAGPGDDAATTIRRVSYADRADGKGLVVRLHATSPVSAYSEPRFEDHKAEFVLFNAVLSEDYRTDSPHDPVMNLSVNAKDGHLIFRFELDAAVTAELVAYPDEGSSDLLLNISTKASSRQQVASNTGRPRLRVVDQSPRRRNQNVRAVSTQRPQPVNPVGDTENGELKLDTIVIDAGHGGKDPGAQAHGVREKDVNLKVALKLGKYIEDLLGINVVYTRFDDTFIELEKRGEIANNSGAKLFISIHANASSRSSTYGTETYFLGLHKTDEAIEVMERENNVINLEDNPEQYSMDNLDIMRTLTMSANLRMSEKLATLVEYQFGNRAQRRSRGVKQAGFIVLYHASMPAILVELGYLTNRTEANYIRSEEGQDYLASAIFRAVRDYREEYEKGLELRIGQ